MYIGREMDFQKYWFFSKDDVISKLSAIQRTLSAYTWICTHPYLSLSLCLSVCLSVCLSLTPARKVNMPDLQPKTQPIQNGTYTLRVICYHLMCDAIRNHHLRPSQLILRAVDILPQKLVERRESCERTGRTCEEPAKHVSFGKWCYKKIPEGGCLLLFTLQISRSAARCDLCLLQHVRIWYFRTSRRRTKHIPRHLSES